jgi:hypothetical protein
MGWKKFAMTENGMLGQFESKSFVDGSLAIEGVVHCEFSYIRGKQ